MPAEFGTLGKNWRNFCEIRPRNEGYDECEHFFQKLFALFYEHG